MSKAGWMILTYNKYFLGLFCLVFAIASNDVYYSIFQMKSTSKPKSILVVRRNRNTSSNKDRSKLLETSTKTLTSSSKSTANSNVTGKENSLARPNFANGSANEAGVANSEAEDASSRTNKHRGQNEVIISVTLKRI